MHNFYSDTQTQPSQAMRETVLSAVVGDEQRKADSTTAELERRVAELLGKEDAVFLPSGTMCNEIAIRVHTDPGDEVICERSSHIINYESGGPAAISSVMVHPIDGQRGMFTADQDHLLPSEVSIGMPPDRACCLGREHRGRQPAELSGPSISWTPWPQSLTTSGLATHLDGARLLNAARPQVAVSASLICRKA